MADTSSFGAFLDATDPTDEENVPASPFDAFADGVDVLRHECVEAIRQDFALSPRTAKRKRRAQHP